MFEEAIKKYFEIKCRELIRVLAERDWKVIFVNDKVEARDKILEIISESGLRTIGIPGSVTIRQIGVITELEKGGFKIIQHWLQIPTEEKNRLRVEETKADVFIHSANAVTMNGEILIADMFGNRVVGSVLGPKMLILVIGVNKIVDDIQQGLRRVREYAAKVNALRLGLDPGKEYDYMILILRRKPLLIKDAYIIIVNEQLGY